MLTTRILTPGGFPDTASAGAALDQLVGTVQTSASGHPVRVTSIRMAQLIRTAEGLDAFVLVEGTPVPPPEPEPEPAADPAWDALACPHPAPPAAALLHPPAYPPVRGTVTDRQLRAIYAIGAKAGLSAGQVDTHCAECFAGQLPTALDSQRASLLITTLQGRVAQ